MLSSRRTRRSFSKMAIQITSHTLVQLRLTTRRTKGPSEFAKMSQKTACSSGPSGWLFRHCQPLFLRQGNYAGIRMCIIRNITVQGILDV